MGFWEFLGDVAEGALEYQSIVANENAEYVDKGIRCYKNGNYNEAFRYFKMAAERNNSNAMYNLALCYRYGEGTDMDYEEAVYWYRKAAEKGVSGAKEAIDEIGSDTGCLIQKDDLFAIRKGYITKFSLSNVSYSWNGNNYTDRKVTIKIGRLQNESAHHSGSVKLKFWYCKTAYNGDHLDGTLMAEDVYSSSGSRGNCYGWSDIEFVMDMDGNPPTGDYFPVLTINELDEDGKWYIVGYCNFDNKKHWNHEEPGKSTDCLIKKDDLYAIRKGFITDFSMSDVSYEWDGDNYTNRRVTIRIGRLQNEAIHHSGSIKLSFRFCNTKYSGETIDGYLMASDIYSKEGCIGEQYGWNDVEFTMDMDGNPPTGDYFPILTVNELDEDGSWYIVGYCNFDKKQHWNHEEDALGVDDMISLADEHWNNEEYEEAAELFLGAAEQGNAYAQYSIGYCYEKGTGTNQDYRKALKWYRKAAEQENADAQYSLGCCYLLGNGVEKCEKEGVRWFRKAAEQGNAAAQYGLGICHEEGTGVKQSYGEAIGWYRKAAKQGDEDAKEAIERVTALMKNQNNTNTTVEERTYNSFDDLKEAAEQGNADAQYYLGLCYEKGNNVPNANCKKAIEWFGKAAKQGNIKALCALGNCYAHGGLGVPQNYAIAVDWYQKAAEKGHKEAIIALKQINNGADLANVGHFIDSSNSEVNEEYINDNHGDVITTEHHSNATNEIYSNNEQEYIETLKEIIADDGEITDRERRLLEKLRTKLGISESRAKELENALANPSLTIEEQEYLDEYKSIAADGEITDKERKLLDKIRKMSGISEERAREIEKMV